MSCPEDRISAWMDGELVQADASAVATHVAECATCQELAASLRDLSTHFSKEIARDHDPGFIVRFRERRELVSVAPWWTWRELALRLVPLAAAVLVAAIAVLWMSQAPAGSLQELERDALGSPVAFESGPEAVLSIAFEPFPENIE